MVPFRTRAGFALPTVLTILIALALVTASRARFLGTAQQGSETIRQIIRSDHDLDSALAQSLSVIHDDSHPLQATLAAGGRIELSASYAPVAVFMIRDSGRIDVNTANDRLLRPVLIGALGQDAGVAAVERAKALKASRGVAFDPLELLPRRLAFAEEGARLISLFTVHSGQPGINPFVAPEAVLKSVPGVDDAMLQELRMLREQGAISSKILSSEAAPYFSSGTDVVTLVATSASGRSRAMTARVAQGTGRVAVLAVRSVPAPSR